MPHIDARSGEVVIRIVYDGAPEAGKTTNIKHLSDQISFQRRGAAGSPGTAGERTEFFDWLDFSGGYLDGRRVRCQLVSVPGQSSLLHRRRYLLETADAVVFVADSRQDQVAHAASSLSTTLRIVSLVEGAVPIGVIVQANKQDHPDALTPEQVVQALGMASATPTVASVASTGDGVMQTFVFAARLATDRVRRLLQDAQLTDLPESAAAPDALHTALRALEDAERRVREEAERSANEEAQRKARADAEAKAREDAERQAKERAERKAKEDAERRAKEDKDEKDRRAKAETERKAQEVRNLLRGRVEAERKAKQEKEEAERKAKQEKEEAERKAKQEKEEAARKAKQEKEEAERKAKQEKEEAERKANREKEEAQRKAKQEAERNAQSLEAERKARAQREEVERRVKAAAEAKAKEFADHKAQELREEAQHMAVEQRRVADEAERSAKEDAEPSAEERRSATEAAELEANAQPDREATTRSDDAPELEVVDLEVVAASEPPPRESPPELRRETPPRPLSLSTSIDVGSPPLDPVMVVATTPPSTGLWALILRFFAWLFGRAP